MWCEQKVVESGVRCDGIPSRGICKSHFITSISRNSFFIIILSNQETIYPDDSNVGHFGRLHDSKELRV